MIGLSSRLAALLRPRQERPVRRAHPLVYEEEEVRDRIYGWHSGTVEPPEPVGSSRLAGIPTGSSAPVAEVAEPGAALGSEPTAETVMPQATASRKGDEK